MPMGFVSTKKLDRGTIEVFGSVTQEMLAWYFGLGLLIWWFDRAFLGNAMFQLLFPLLILVPLHFVVVAVMQLPVVTVITAAFRFGAFTADYYRVTHDPNPLPFLIPAAHRPVIAKASRVSRPDRARTEIPNEVIA
jgi:hypothetical protein